MFFEYGDDSVAQLGGVHLACEQASNLLTKVLEWGRLMAYLEQSTRYIAYDTRLGGRYRYYRDPEVLGSPLGTRYVGDMDRLFDTYAELVPGCSSTSGACSRRSRATPTSSTARRIKAKAFDALRGILPAASLSNVGIYGTGQAYEALLLRMRAHPLPEARLRRPDADRAAQGDPVVPQAGRPRRPGVAWSTYLAADPHRRWRTSPPGCSRRARPADARTCAGRLRPRRRGQAGRRRCSTPTPTCPRTRSSAGCGRCPPRSGWRWCGPTWATAPTAATSPGGRSSGPRYRFDVLADYGAFRDLQRHRMLTDRVAGAHAPPRLHPARGGRRGRGRRRFDEAMDRSAALYDVLAERFPAQAAYAVCLAYRVRFVMQLNAREAMHLLELRTRPRATRPTGGWPRRCTGSSPSRPATTPWPR